MKRWKYDVLNQVGIREPFSGIFQNESKALEWYNRHGKKHESKGYKLVKVVAKYGEENH